MGIIHWTGPVARLPQVTFSSPGIVEVGGISGVHRMEDLGQRRFRGRNSNDVNMVAHKAESKQRYPAFLGVPVHQPAVCPVIIILLKNRLLEIPSLGHMMRSVRNYDPGLSRHGWSPLARHSWGISCRWGGGPIPLCAEYTSIILNGQLELRRSSTRFKRMDVDRRK
jgi:hypothetical protein